LITRRWQVGEHAVALSARLDELKGEGWQCSFDRE
jgi:hypothetical protein